MVLLMREIVIHSWDELQKHLFDNVWDEQTQRYRSNYIYRGVAHSEYGLTPSLNRYCSHDLTLEDSLLRNFKKYGSADLGGYQNFWQLVALAQHHGLPTRLLDWSYSPLVAAHFATCDVSEYDHDGAITCVNFELLNAQLPKPMVDKVIEYKSKCFTIDMLNETVTNFKDLEKMSDKPFVFFFEPASISDRIVNQYALFSVVSDPSVSLLDILKDYPELCEKIIIPKEVKLEIRDKLDYINISERFIYPGLDGICQWLTRRYMDLGPKYNKNHHNHD